MRSPLSIVIPSPLPRLWTAFTLILVLAFAPQPTVAQDAARRDTSKPFERQIYACFDRGEYQKAIDLIEQHLKTAPSDHQMLYNGACAHCLLNKPDDAASWLLRAVKAGFTDFDHMQSDPDLAPIRAHPTYLAIVEAADRVAKRQAKSAVELWREKYGEERYRYETDQERRINYATALDEVSHQSMREMLEREADQLFATLFDEPPRYYILIAVPTPADSHEFFEGNDNIGGMYDHGRRRLVSRDIGGSLRHEFFHAMHYGDMQRRNQAHPLWIQEGLATLYEDYELSKDGAIKFLPNDRQFIVKNRVKSGILTPWKKLFKLSAEEFMSKPAQLYPEVRSIFEFVAEHGKLAAWYKSYVTHFADDRTGVTAFEEVFSQPLADIERSWRKWVSDQPAIDIHVEYGDASIGIRSRENGSNDGVLITDIVPGSAASRGTLRRGDVITSIDGTPTPSLADLRKLIAARKVGDKVEVRARRKGEYFTVTLTLQPLHGGT
jgi:hypothetical protein